MKLEWGGTCGATEILAFWKNTFPSLFITPLTSPNYLLDLKNFGIWAIVDDITFVKIISTLLNTDKDLIFEKYYAFWRDRYKQLIIDFNRSRWIIFLHFNWWVSCFCFCLLLCIFKTILLLLTLPAHELTSDTTDNWNILVSVNLQS